jgi:hypothetical protein
MDHVTDRQQWRIRRNEEPKNLFRRPNIAAEITRRRLIFRSEERGFVGHRRSSRKIRLGKYQQADRVYDGYTVSKGYESECKNDRPIVSCSTSRKQIELVGLKRLIGEQKKKKNKKRRPFSDRFSVESHRNRWPNINFNGRHDEQPCNEMVGRERNQNDICAR